MDEMIVADDHCIINTQGIRYVEKSESSPVYRQESQPYRLRVTYKGDKLDYGYADKDKRDAQFEALRTAMLAFRSNQVKQ